MHSFFFFFSQTRPQLQCVALIDYAPVLKKTAPSRVGFDRCFVLQFSVEQCGIYSVLIALY